MGNFNVTVFQGGRYLVKKFNYFRDQAVDIPEGALFLSSEIVVKEDTDGEAEELVEVWLALPEESVLVNKTTKTLEEHTYLPTEEQRKVTEDELDKMLASDEDVWLDDEEDEDDEGWLDE